MMVCLLLYAYCVGVFSSRKMALACERNLAFMAIVGQERPDFRTISDFRKLHLEAFKDVFVHVVRLAGEAGLVKLGNVSTDGTKIQGNASRHKAMSYGYMKTTVERLREEIETLVTAAYQHYLGRTPAPSEVAGWVGAFEAGQATNEDVVAGFLASAEFFQAHGGDPGDWFAQAALAPGRSA